MALGTSLPARVAQGFRVLRCLPLVVVVVAYAPLRSHVPTFVLEQQLLTTSTHVAPVAAAVAGATAAAAYLDARYHIRQDLQTIRLGKKVEKEFRKAGEAPPDDAVQRNVVRTRMAAAIGLVEADQDTRAQVRTTSRASGTFSKTR